MLCHVRLFRADVKDATRRVSFNARWQLGRPNKKRAGPAAESPFASSSSSFCSSSSAPAPYTLLCSRPLWSITSLHVHRQWQEDPMWPMFRTTSSQQKRPKEVIEISDSEDDEAAQVASQLTPKKKRSQTPQAAAAAAAAGPSTAMAANTHYSDYLTQTQQGAGLDPDFGIYGGYLDATARSSSVNGGGSSSVGRTSPAVAAHLLGHTSPAPVDVKPSFHGAAGFGGYGGLGPFPEDRKPSLSDKPEYEEDRKPSVVKSEDAPHWSERSRSKSEDEQDQGELPEVEIDLGESWQLSRRDPFSDLAPRYFSRRPTSSGRPRQNLDHRDLHPRTRHQPCRHPDPQPPSHAQGTEPQRFRSRQRGER